MKSVYRILCGNALVLCTLYFMTNVSSKHRPALCSGTFDAILRLFIAIVVILICLLPAYRYAGVGMFFFDEPYQILNCRDYLNSPLAPLTGWLGGVIGNAFGWEWLHFRYLAIGCTAVSILAGCVWMWHKTRAFVPTLLVGAACLVLATTMRTHLIVFGWDNFALLFTTLLMVATLSALEKPTWSKIVILSVLSALSVWVRVPDIVAVPIVAVALFFTHGEYRLRLKRVIIYIATTVILSVVILLLLYGSFSAYVSALAANAIDSHSKFTILLTFFLGGISVAFASLSFFGANAVLAIRFHNKWQLAVGIGGMILILFYALFGRAISVYMFMTGFMMMFAGAVCYYGIKMGRKDVALEIGLLFCLSLVPCVGSNTGLNKMIVFPLLPIGLACLRMIRMTSIGYTAVSCACAMFLFLPSHLKHGYGILDGVSESTEVFTEGIFKGMSTSPENKAILTAVQTDMAPYMRVNTKLIILRANVDYVYEYMFNSRNEYLRHRFDAAGCVASREYIDWVRQEIAGDGHHTVLYFLPDDGASNPMQQMLDERLDRAVVTPRYIIYSR